METIEGYAIDIIYLKKKNSSAQIRDGRVILRIATRLSTRDRNRHIETLLEKVRKRLTQVQSDDELYPKALTDGQFIRVLGDRCMLHIELNTRRKHPGLKLHGRSVTLTVPVLPDAHDDQLDLLRKFRQLMAQKKADWLFQYLTDLNAETTKSKKISMAAFREQLTRWGSCSPHGSINISSRLIFCPLHLLRYVCIHELCHLVHPDHSVKFWDLVRRFTPDVNASRKELKMYL